MVVYRADLLEPDILTFGYRDSFTLNSLNISGSVSSVVNFGRMKWRRGIENSLCNTQHFFKIKPQWPHVLWKEIWMPFRHFMLPLVAVDTVRGLDLIILVVSATRKRFRHGYPEMTGAGFEDQLKPGCRLVTVQEPKCSRVMWRVVWAGIIIFGTTLTLQNTDTVTIFWLIPTIHDKRILDTNDNVLCIYE